jgi:hypothetical protein
MSLASAVLGVFAAAYWTTRVACSLAEVVLIGDGDGADDGCDGAEDEGEDDSL